MECLSCESPCSPGRKNLCNHCYKKQYYINNREKILSLQRARLLKNIENNRVYQRNFYHKKQAELGLKKSLFIGPPKPSKKSSRNSGSINSDGYRLLSKKDHPNAMKHGRILEHVFIMSCHLCRPLKKNERVHHKNGFRSDNRIENLELWTTSHPAGQRVIDKIDWAIEFLQSYGYKIDFM